MHSQSNSAADEARRAFASIRAAVDAAAATVEALRQLPETLGEISAAVAAAQRAAAALESLNRPAGGADGLVALDSLLALRDASEAATFARGSAADVAAILQGLRSAAADARAAATTLESLQTAMASLGASATGAAPADPKMAPK